jgi:hypothetical protein
MGSKIPTYVGWAVIAWFVWKNFGGTISSALGSFSGLAGGLGGASGGSGGSAYPGRASSAAPYTPQTAASRNKYYRG